MGKSISSAAIALAICAYVPADAAEDISALLRAKTQMFTDAGQNGNADVLKALLDDRVVFFNENGGASTKDDIVAAASPSPAGSGVKMIVTDWQCVVHGDVAVASFIDDQTKDLHGQIFHAQYRSVETWLHQADTWRIIASQTIALQTDPAAVTLPPAVLDQYVGTYQATPALTAVFARTGADLTLATNGAAPVVQRAELRDVVFTSGNPRTRRIFTRDAHGNITGFISRREGHDIVFKRVEQG